MSAKLAAALLVRGPQGVRRRVRGMQKVVDDVQAVLDRCVEAERIERNRDRGPRLGEEEGLCRQAVEKPKSTKVVCHNRGEGLH